MKCAKLGKIFIAEREMRIKVSKRGMVKKEIIKGKATRNWGQSAFHKIKHIEKKLKFILEFNHNLVIKIW